MFGAIKKSVIVIRFNPFTFSHSGIDILFWGTYGIFNLIKAGLAYGNNNERKTELCYLTRALDMYTRLYNGSDHFDLVVLLNVFIRFFSI